MDGFTCQLGTSENFHCGGNGYTYGGENTGQECAHFWRPWAHKPCEPKTYTVSAHTDASDALPDAKKKAFSIVHPVKLFWPKSRCFDYLYQDAEVLLRNYPVQATICPYADSSSDEDEDSDGEDEKEMN